MTSPFGPLHLIVNPRAGRGAVAKSLPRLLDELRANDLEYRIVETTAPRHAAEAARQVLDEGGQYLVAVGGDGTVHEVVNGMFEGEKPVNPEAVFGVAAAGSGCDFVRTFGLDRKPQFVARHLASDATMPIDVGVVEYVDLEGKLTRTLFANIAEVGYGAEVVRRAARYPRWFGRLRYLLGAYAAMVGGERPVTTVKVAHTEKTAPLVELVVANCQFFGGAMKVAPRALPDDGKFNVQLYHGRRSQFFLLTMKIYRGEHLPDPEITEYQSATAELAPVPPQLVEADGEVLGHTPARFWLLERALRLKI
jgi:YegS/Rv2252/BmrU family lipid kinase